MKNKDQIRARNAMNSIPRIRMARGEEGGDVLTGFPALVQNNGLLSTLAFCKQKQKGHETICDEIARHLADPEIGLLRDPKPCLDSLLTHLVESDSSTLRLVTSETMAFLNYLRRFGKGVEE